MAEYIQYYDQKVSNSDYLSCARHKSTNRSKKQPSTVNISDRSYVQLINEEKELRQEIDNVINLSKFLKEQ